MSGIKNYIEDLSFRTADALQADGYTDSNTNLVSWHFGEEPAEYIMACMFSGKVGCHEIWGELISYRGDLPYDSYTPNLDSIIYELEAWFPEFTQERIEDYEMELSALGYDLFKTTRIGRCENRRDY